MPPQQRTGTLKAVPCPHCGRKLDCSELEEMLEIGMKIECDPPHAPDPADRGCGRTSTVTAVQPATLVTLVGTG